MEGSEEWFTRARPGTVAFDLKLIEKKVSIQRLEKIQKKLYVNQTNKNKLLENQIINVLVENQTNDMTRTFGRSEYMTSVVFDGKKEHIGKIMSVKIKKFNRTTLFGELVKDSNQKVA